MKPDLCGSDPRGDIDRAVVISRGNIPRPRLVAPQSSAGPWISRFPSQAAFRSVINPEPDD